MEEREEIDELRVRLLGALADPTRLEILRCLKDGERCVCEILPESGKAQSTTSKHLAILHNAEILKRRIEGVKTLYSIKRPEVFVILKEVDKLILEEAKDMKRRIKIMEVTT